MAKDLNPAQTYATTKANEWLYDADGRCPFTRVRLESVIISAFQAGEASALSKGALTAKQREAVCTVLDERIAGGVDDLRDALGLPNKAAASEMIRMLERAANKLAVKNA